jgi:hypothetical protein
VRASHRSLRNERELQLLAEARQIDTTCYVILNPVRVPPLFGVNLDTIQLHGEMYVIAACHSCHAAQAHYLSARNSITRANIDAAQVPVNGLQAVTMIDHDAHDRRWTLQRPHAV